VNKKRVKNGIEEWNEERAKGGRKINKQNKTKKISLLDSITESLDFSSSFEKSGLCI
jgi:hypothetical protein